MTDSTKTTNAYQRMTPKAAFQLMAPHTWIAAIAPVIVGGVPTIGLRDYTPFDLLGHAWLATVIGALMLLTAILAQSAANVLNDYYDFKAGTDTKENMVDETDAALIYHQVNPKAAKHFALTCFGAALACGLLVVALAGDWRVLLLGLVGAAIVLLYSAGPKPISYLPLGELVSGLVMGGFITIATYLAMTGHLSIMAVLGAAVPLITIAMIMQVNNTADIKRDSEAGRRTLPILLGERASSFMIVSMQVLALSFAGFYVFTIAPWGIPAMIAATLLSFRHLKVLKAGPYTTENRPAVMKAVVAQAVITNLAFVFAILLGAHFV